MKCPIFNKELKEKTFSICLKNINFFLLFFLIKLIYLEKVTRILCFISAENVVTDLTALNIIWLLIKVP